MARGKSTKKKKVSKPIVRFEPIIEPYPGHESEPNEVTHEYKIDENEAYFYHQKRTILKKNGKFRCSECSNLFATHKLLLEHYKLHDTTSHSCIRCDLKFIDHYTLSQHLYDKHRHCTRNLYHWNALSDGIIPKEENKITEITNPILTNTTTTTTTTKDGQGKGKVRKGGRNKRKQNNKNKNGKNNNNNNNKNLNGTVINGVLISDNFSSLYQPDVNNINSRNWSMTTMAPVLGFAECTAPPMHDYYAVVSEKCARNDHGVYECDNCVINDYGEHLKFVSLFALESHQKRFGCDKLIRSSVIDVIGNLIDRVDLEVKYNHQVPSFESHRKKGEPFVRQLERLDSSDEKIGEIARLEIIKKLIAETIRRKTKLDDNTRKILDKFYPLLTKKNKMDEPVNKFDNRSILPVNAQKNLWLEELDNEKSEVTSQYTTFPVSHSHRTMLKDQNRLRMSFIERDLFHGAMSANLSVAKSKLIARKQMSSTAKVITRRYLHWMKLRQSKQLFPITKQSLICSTSYIERLLKDMTDLEEHKFFMKINSTKPDRILSTSALNTNSINQFIQTDEPIVYWKMPVNGEKDLYKTVKRPEDERVLDRPNLLKKYIEKEVMVKPLRSHIPNDDAKKKKKKRQPIDEEETNEEKQNRLREESLAQYKKYKTLIGVRYRKNSMRKLKKRQLIRRWFMEINARRKQLENKDVLLRHYFDRQKKIVQLFRHRYRSKCRVNRSLFYLRKMKNLYEKELTYVRNIQKFKRNPNPLSERATRKKENDEFNRLLPILNKLLTNKQSMKNLRISIFRHVSATIMSELEFQIDKFLNDVDRDMIDEMNIEYTIERLLNTICPNNKKDLTLPEEDLKNYIEEEFYESLERQLEDLKNILDLKEYSITELLELEFKDDEIYLSLKKFDILYRLIYKMNHCDFIDYSNDVLLIPEHLYSGKTDIENTPIWKDLEPKTNFPITRSNYIFLNTTDIINRFMFTIHLFFNKVSWRLNSNKFCEDLTTMFNVDTSPSKHVLPITNNKDKDKSNEKTDQNKNSKSRKFSLKQHQNSPSKNRSNNNKKRTEKELNTNRIIGNHIQNIEPNTSTINVTKIEVGKVNKQMEESSSNKEENSKPNYKIISTTFNENFMPNNLIPKNTTNGISRQMHKNNIEIINIKSTKNTDNGAEKKRKINTETNNNQIDDNDNTINGNDNTINGNDGNDDDDDDDEMDGDDVETISRKTMDRLNYQFKSLIKSFATDKKLTDELIFRYQETCADVEEENRLLRRKKKDQIPKSLS
ncbi:hypothetical protein SNEBB_007285 [Seison nebaliae]|nr:hypothetical protein SNEBB_007285 [Seison nebaliae]